MGNRKSEIRLCAQTSNQKSDFEPRPPIENVGIGCGQLDIGGGRGEGGRWAIFFLHYFFFEPNTLPDIFFANISLHDLFYGKRSSLCDLFGLITGNQYFLVMGFGSSARFVVSPEFICCEICAPIFLVFTQASEEALRPIRLLESRNQESGIVLKTFLNSCFASQETCFPPLIARSLEQ